MRMKITWAQKRLTKSPSDSKGAPLKNPIFLDWLDCTVLHAQNVNFWPDKNSQKTRSDWLIAFVIIFSKKIWNNQEIHLKKSTLFFLQLSFENFAKKSVGLFRSQSSVKTELVQHIFSVFGGKSVEGVTMPNPGRRYRGGTPPRPTTASQSRRP